MKAFILTKYGPPDVLQLQEIPKPVPKEDQVLVKTHAASLNAADWHLMRGSPFLMRMMFGGILKPKFRILGADISGRIVAAGSKVSRFQPGDAVFGDISSCGWGSFAEYVAVDAAFLAKKPVDMSFEEAAAVPLAAVTALQALRDAGGVRPGFQVLINGASGGVGTFAIQIAKSFGAEVTAVCSTHKMELARSLGADRVIDYTVDDITGSNRLFDLVVDIASYRPPSVYKRILKKAGTYVLIGGSTGNAMKMMVFGGLISRVAGRKFTSVMATPNGKDLEFIRDLLEAGKLRPVIDRTFALADLPEAMRYLEEGHARGKIVISM